VSLVVGLGAVALGLLIGGTMGLIGGYLRGRLDGAIVIVIDVLLAFPMLVMAIAITAYLGQTLWWVTVAIAIGSIPAFARVLRATALSVSERDYVRASRSLGASHVRVLREDVLPNVTPVVATLSCIAVAVAIVAEGGLSYLGLGVPPPQPSWGAMIAGGRTVLATAPHVSLEPAAVLFVTVLAFNLAGDRVQRRLSRPRRR
jgi:peptide/nickel transport system permease protein